MRRCEREESADCSLCVWRKVKATPPRMAYRKIAQLAALTLSIVPIVLRGVIKCQESECLSRVQEPLEVIYVRKLCALLDGARRKRSRLTRPTLVCMCASVVAHAHASRAVARSSVHTSANA